MIAEEIHAVASLNEGQSLGRKALELGGLHLGAILLALQTVLEALVFVEGALDAGGGAVEEVNLAPEQFFEVGLDAGVSNSPRPLV